MNTQIFHLKVSPQRSLQVTKVHPILNPSPIGWSVDASPSKLCGDLSPSLFLSLFLFLSPSFFLQKFPSYNT